MSNFCNSVFFCRNQKKAISEVVEQLKPFMLSKDNMKNVAVIEEEEEIKDVETIVLEEGKEHLNEMVTVIPEEVEEIQMVTEHECTEEHIEEEEEKKEETIQTTPEYITPTHPDTLFWCIYIATCGYNDYQQIDRNYGMKELDVKKQIATFVQKNPSKMKETNIKITKVATQEILSELLTSQKETSLLCLVAMILYYNINVVLVDPTNQFMLEFLSNESEPTSVPTFALYKDTYGKYKLQVDPVDLAIFKTTKIGLETYLKPLKSISNYNMEELVTLSKRIGRYDDTVKHKKAELYEMITEHIRWR